MTVDHRRFARIPFNAAVRLTLSESTPEPIPGTLQDVSLKGAMICLDHPDTKTTISVGQQTELVIQPEQTDLQMLMTAEVAYCLPERGIYGLNFISLDIESAGHLRRLVEVNLGNDSSLQRELHNLIEAVEAERSD